MWTVPTLPRFVAIVTAQGYASAASRRPPRATPHSIRGMPAYLVVDVRRTDAEKAARYGAVSPATVARYGGRYLARGGATTVLEGGWDPERLVVIEFPSAERAREWYASAEYQAARKLREGAGEWRMVLIEGVEPPGRSAAERR